MTGISIHNGKIVPFAGWEMPVWYSSVVEEHMATRKSAGLFDVTHMGVYQVEGIDALSFLDSVCANDISTLKLVNLAIRIFWIQMPMSLMICLFIITTRMNI